MDPIIYTSKVGNLANQMIQFMAALRIAAEVDGCQIGGVDLPDWGIALPEVQTDPQRTLRLSSIVNGVRTNNVGVSNIAKMLNSRSYDSVGIYSYSQHMANFLPVEHYRKVFQSDVDVVGFGSDKIVINIRGNEILSGIHPEYVLLPVEYYKGIVAHTGLDPVFIGQLNPNPYLSNLKDSFPNAEFVPSRGPIVDFQTIRRSRNIVLAVSTFSWLAAWLSDAVNIFMPLSGLFNPFQYPAIDLVPLDDKRYHFDLFPINYAVPVDRYHLGHCAMQGYWRRITAEMLLALRDNSPRFGFDDLAMFDNFDEAYYLSANPDVQRAVSSGQFASGFEHFKRAGYIEGRAAFHIDAEWYCSSYPVAAFEVGQGDFRCLHSHYLQVGRLRGYHPTRGQ